MTPENSPDLSWKDVNGKGVIGEHSGDREEVFQLHGAGKIWQ